MPLWSATRPLTRSRRGAQASPLSECYRGAFRGTISRRADASRCIAIRRICSHATGKPSRRQASRPRDWHKSASSEPRGTRSRLRPRPERTGAPCGGGLRGATVHLALGHGSQFFIDRFFLIEVLLQQGCAVVTPQLFGPGDQRAVARDLIVFDGLRRSDERGVENGFVLHLAGHLFGLVDDAVDRWTIHAPRFLAEQLEDLLQAHHLVLRLTQVRFKT